MKLYVEEEGSARARDQVSAATVVATATIAYVEARAALARRRRARDMSAGEHRRLVGEIDTDWERYLRLQVTDGLIREAAGLAEQHALRAYDAIHLAAAVTTRRGLGEDLVFACADSDLARAAARERLGVTRF